MTKHEMNAHLATVSMQLEYADEARLTDDASRIAIGALIIAIDHLREVAQELVEKEAKA